MLQICMSLSLAFFAQGPQESPAKTYSIEGLVRDALGEPVAAADVWVTDPERLEAPEVVLARGKTDGSGVFVIGRVPERKYWMVHAASPGRCVDAEFLDPRDTVASLRLFDGATVRGTFVDAQGQPVAGAEVIAAFDLARVLHDTHPTAITGADGEFELAGVPLGVIDVRAWKRGVGLAMTRVHVRDDTEVTLVPAGEGVGIDVAVHGLPPNAKRPSVWVLPYDQGSLQTLPSELVRGVVDAEGTWHTQDLPKWEYLIQVDTPGFAFAPASQRVTPSGPHTSVEFDARETASIQVSGNLVDDRGAPLSGVRLALRAAESALRSEAVTAEDGTFTFESVLAPGSACIVQSLDARWVLDQRKDERMYGSWDERFLAWHEWKVDPDTPLSLRATAAASLEGRILRADGGPVPFARVTLESARDNRSPQWMDKGFGRTGRDGRFRITGQHASEYSVRVVVQDGAGAVESEAFALTDGAKIVLPDLELVPPAAVSGVVVDGQGKPVPGARVWLRTWDLGTGKQKDGSVTEVITDRAGRYGFIGVAPGGYYLQVLLTETRRVGVAAKPSLERNGHFAECDTRADGTFVLSQLPRKFVMAVTRRGQLLASRAFDLAPSGVVRCDFDLPELQTVRGRVLDPEGKPLPAWNVRASDASGHKDFTTSLADGSFELSLAASGPLRVEALLPGPDSDRPVVKLDGVSLGTEGLELRVPADAVRAADTAEPVATVPASLTSELRVEITRADGEPWTGALPWVEVCDRDGRRAEREDEPMSGAVRVRVPAGHYRVTPSGDDLIVAAQEVDIAAGQTRTLRFKIAIGRTRALTCNSDGAIRPKSRALLHMIVRDAAGTVVAREDLKARQWWVTDYNYWQLDHPLPFGRYSVEAHTDDGVRYAGTFAVRENLDDPTRVDVPRLP